MATSNSYTFGVNAKLDDLFREAFENIGIIQNELTGLQIKSAIYSANLELSSWPGKGLNLFTVKPSMVSLMPFQSTYLLPINAVRIPYQECAITQPVRLNIGGTAFSSAGGVAANCFDPTTTAGCIQTTPNGYISYDYGNNNSNCILYVGVNSLLQSFYTLTVDYSIDNVNWNTVFIAPTQEYFPGVVQWLVLQFSPPARYWRIRETKGATLQIQQIYFSIPNVNQTNRIIQPLSRFQYLAMQTTQTTSDTLTGYYLDLAAQPILVGYPIPNTPGYNLLFNLITFPQDVVYMFQSVQVPQKFMDALAKGLADRLAFKFKPEKLVITTPAAQEAYRLAAAMDFENVPLNIMPNTRSFGAV